MITLKENSKKKNNFHIGKKKASSKVSLPSKRTINLLSNEEKTIDPKKMVITCVILVIALSMFCKFAVFDKLMAANTAESEVANVRAELDEAYIKLSQLTDVTDEYAHYTYSGMTSEELLRVDRVDIMNLLDRIVLPKAVVNSWSIQDNQLTLYMGSNTLQAINLVVQDVEQDEMVDFCIVETAATKDDTKNTGRVNAKVTIILKNAPSNQ